MSQRISGHDLAEWSAFERVFGPITLHERIDYAAAEICAVLAGKPLDDALLKWDARPMTPAEEFESWKRTLMKIVPEELPHRHRI